MEKKKLHYGWLVIFMGLFTTIAAHGFGLMAYTIILPAMKDGLKFDYTQLGLLGTGHLKIADKIAGSKQTKLGLNSIIPSLVCLEPAILSAIFKWPL